MAGSQGAPVLRWRCLDPGVGGVSSRQAEGRLHDQVLGRRIFPLVFWILGTVVYTSWNGGWVLVLF